MDILYIVNKPSMELRYSLRSLEKYGRNVSNVYVVTHGDIPFLDNTINVIHDKRFLTKNKDIMDGILYTIHNTDISDKFFFACDDFFFLNPFDCNEEKYKYKEVLCDSIPSIIRDGSDAWNAVMYNTRKYLEKLGCDKTKLLNFSQHNLAIISKSTLLEYESEIDEMLHTPFEPGVEVMSFSANLYLKDHPEAEKLLEFRQDHKIMESSKEIPTLESVKDYDCISYDDIPFISKAGDIIPELFPNKCKYEKDLNGWIRYNKAP